MDTLLAVVATLLLVTAAYAETLRFRFDQPNGCDVLSGWEVHVTGGVCGLPDHVLAVLPKQGPCGLGDCGFGMQRYVTIELPPGTYVTYLVGLFDQGKTNPSNVAIFTVP